MKMSGPARASEFDSPEHLALTKFAVEEAAKRGMKVWLADEGSYPSGFTGGRISKAYPQLSMQGIVAAPPPAEGVAAQRRRFRVCWGRSGWWRANHGSLDILERTSWWHRKS